MAEFPGFTIWTDAYLADTGHLTTLEHGAYFLLLIRMWRAGGYLPNNDEKLARCAGVGLAQWAKLKPTLMEFFTVEKQGLTQGRLQDELEKSRKRSEKASESARAKYRKTKDVAPANATPEHSLEPASITITITNEEKEPSSTSPKREKRGSRLPEDFKPDQVWSKAQGMPKEWLVDQFEQFRDYWKSVSGAKGVKLDWDATWRNWVRTAKGRSKGGSQKPESEWATYQRKMTETVERAAGYDRSKPTDDDDSGSTIDLGTADYRSRPSTGSSSR